MAETKVYLPDRLDAQLREAAMKRFGYGRGSISKAFETAVVQWLAREDAIAGAIRSIVRKAKEDRNVVAVLLFGSYARKEPGFGDVDVALVLKDPGKSDPSSFESPVEGRGPFGRVKVDIRVFNTLPLDMQRSVLNEGQVAYSRDENELRAVCAAVAEKWDDFAPTLSYLTSSQRLESHG